MKELSKRRVENFSIKDTKFTENYDQGAEQDAKSLQGNPWVNKIIEI